MSSASRIESVPVRPNPAPITWMVMRAACGKPRVTVESARELAALMYALLMARGRSHCTLDRERLFTVAVLAFTALSACGFDAPNRATAPIYKGDDETSGGQARAKPSAK